MNDFRMGFAALNFEEDWAEDGGLGYALGFSNRRREELSALWPPLTKRKEIQAFELGDHTPEHMRSRLSKDEWKTVAPPQCGWYVVAVTGDYWRDHWRGYWDGSLWTDIVGMIDPAYRVKPTAEQSPQIKWMRPCTAGEIEARQIIVLPAEAQS